MFIGGATLPTECHTPSERGKAQGANDLVIFVTMIAASLSSGLMFTLHGWELMNHLTVPFLLLTGAAMLWLAAVRRRPVQPIAH